MISNDILTILNREYGSKGVLDTSNSLYTLEEIQAQNQQAEPEFLAALLKVIQTSKLNNSVASIYKSILLALYRPNEFCFSIADLSSLEEDEFSLCMTVITYQNHVNRRKIHLYLPQHTSYVQNLAVNRSK